MNTAVHFLVALSVLSEAPRPGNADRPGQSLAVSTDFEGGSATVLSVEPDRQAVRLSPAGNPREGWPVWWYARIDGRRPDAPLSLEVVAPPVKLPADGGGRGHTLGSVWALPTRATYSTDGKTWRHTEPGKRDGEMASYVVPAGGATAYVAWGPPFTTKDAAALVAEAEAATPAAKGFELCQSNAGRPVPALRVREGDRPDARRPGVWVEARQHAWEAGSSWVLRGFTLWLVGDDPRAVWVRRNAEVFIVPVMDVDHVAAGQGGKEAVPQDHNRDWSDAPHWAEVRAAQKHIQGLAAAGRADLFLDLHNPGAQNLRPHFVVHPSPLLTPAGRASRNRWLAAARAEIAAPLALTESPKEATPDGKSGYDQASIAWVVANANPHTVATCLETPWNTAFSTPEGYQAVGSQLGLAIERFLRASPREEK